MAEAKKNPTVRITGEFGTGKAKVSAHVDVALTEFLMGGPGLSQGMHMLKAQLAQKAMLAATTSTPSPEDAPEDDGAEGPAPEPAPEPAA